MTSAKIAGRKKIRSKQENTPKMINVPRQHYLINCASFTYFEISASRSNQTVSRQRSRNAVLSWGMPSFTSRLRAFGALAKSNSSARSFTHCTRRLSSPRLNSKRNKDRQKFASLSKQSRNIWMRDPNSRTGRFRVRWLNKMTRSASWSRGRS